MDITSVASLANDLHAGQLGQDVSIAVLKRALDAEASTAAQLIAAVPAPRLPANLGQTVNTIA